MAVDFAHKDGIGTITLNRPPANSYEAGFVDELGAAVAAVADDDDVKAVVVRSALEKFFCAGADIKAFTENSAGANVEMVIASHAVLSSIARIPKIFIAEIGGHALGGGLEIALACDLRFAAEGEYRLGVPESQLGLLPGNGGTQRLPRLIGWSRALDLMITGRTLTPDEALELGIVNRVVSADRLAAETRDYAARLAAGALKAIGSIKLAVHETLELSLEEGLKREQELISELFLSEDAREGLAAFVEKRKPAFTGS